MFTVLSVTAASLVPSGEQAATPLASRLHDHRMEQVTKRSVAVCD